jgi:hypothetical protein
MYNSDDRPLGTIAEDAYEILVETVDPEDGMPREEAHAELLDGDFVDSDAEYAIDRLLSRGYLYAVNGQLFVTEHKLNSDE